MVKQAMSGMMLSNPRLFRRGAGRFAAQGKKLRRKARSLRGRTTAAACLVLGLAVLIGAGSLLVALRHSLLRNVDATATLRAKDVAGLILAGTLPPSLALPERGDAVIQVVDSHGVVVASSANLKQTTPITTWRPQSKQATTRTISGLPTDRHAQFRLVALPAPAPSGPVTVYAAIDLDQVEATRRYPRS